MNDHSLPEDLSLWPTNPFALLGVAPDVSAGDLRRAYTALVRVYKPEHFPDHFRCIGLAYEAAQARIQDNTDLLPFARASLPVATSDDSADAARTHRGPEFEKELETAWNWAEKGDGARSYACLLELQQRHPWRADIYIRLYSLLDVSPELDAERSPCDFLAQGLRQTGGGGPCQDLYRQAIEKDPAEALTARFAGVISATTDLPLLLTFVQWRWSAAGQMKRFEVISEDLPALRGQLADQDETWLHLLCAAADQVAWAPAPTGPEFLSACTREVARFGHLQLRCEAVFDRIDRLDRVVEGWRRLRRRRRVPSAFLDVVSQSWTRPFPQVRRRLISLLAAIRRDRRLWLAHFYRIFNKAAPLLVYFGEILTTFEATVHLDADTRTSEDLQALVQSFLEEHGDLPYDELRPYILEFCVWELIRPELFAEFAAATHVRLGEFVVRELKADRPLQYVYRAHFLFVRI